VGLQPHERVNARFGPLGPANRSAAKAGSILAPPFRGLNRLRKNAVLPSVLKGHGFSHADKGNKINVDFSPRGLYFENLPGIQPFFRSL
jgi:hypothetical protein